MSIPQPSFIDELRVAVAAMQAQKPEKLGAIGRAHALIVDGFVVDNHDGTGKVLASNLSEYYTVNGTCDCGAGAHGKPCKHMDAWGLYKYVSNKLAAGTPTGPTPEETADLDQIPKEYIHWMHGKPHVLYKGLLAMAHEKGLVSLEAGFIEVTKDGALAWARATFPNGRIFVEAADATRENVANAKIAPHYPRMALTRAKARALRDALNIGVCSVEEMA